MGADVNTLDLDSMNAIRLADPGGMLERIVDLPQQLRDAWVNVSGFDMPEEYSQVKQVMVLGMGGSAIGADLLRTLVADESPIPVFVNREYHLPDFVGPDTLVIASSYSGNTEETLSAFDDALGCRSKILAVTTGGKLADRCTELGIPLLRFSYAAQPRAALGHSLIPLLGIMQKLGFVAGKADQVEGAARALEELSLELGPGIPKDNNPAKSLACDLFDRLPIVYGSGILAEVARRWKGQFNENAKAWSYFEVLPELNHNATVGYENPAQLASKLLVIFLESTLYHPRVLLRAEITRRILDQRDVTYRVVNSRGDTALSHMMTGVYFGDYVSFYLAMLYGVDPSPVKVIDYLKSQLADR
jgi:glucose/mannose-6-phosphate isomerase